MRKGTEGQKEDVAAGRRLYDETRTPLEEYQQTLRELDRLKSVGALGTAGYSNVYDRAMLEAKDKYEAAVGKGKGASEPEARTPEGPGVLERGSAEAWQKIVGQMYGTGRDKQQEQLVRNTGATVEELRRLANREPEEVGIA
ncbi:MAG: hypothetical protein NTW96_24525 [Planctomycetia bacterium]|nr:hypothetical protein [Planctomycetia bacterium]